MCSEVFVFVATDVLFLDFDVIDFFVSNPYNCVDCSDGVNADEHIARQSIEHGNRELKCSCIQSFERRLVRVIGFVRRDV